MVRTLPGSQWIWAPDYVLTLVREPIEKCLNPNPCTIKAVWLWVSHFTSLSSDSSHWQKGSSNLIGSYSSGKCDFYDSKKREGVNPILIATTKNS